MAEPTSPPDAGNGTDDLSAKLIEDARQAISVEPEAAGESGADQWYVSDIAVDCDTDTLLRVLAHGLIAAGWRPPLAEDSRMSDQMPRMPNFWWSPTNHLYRGGDKRPCADAVRLVPESAEHQPAQDSETEWGTRDRHGQVHSVGVENETQARSMLSMTPVRREVGPWIEVPHV